jgi:hypothetical protein
MIWGALLTQSTDIASWYTICPHLSTHTPLTVNPGIPFFCLHHPLPSEGESVPITNMQGLIHIQIYPLPL